MMLWTLLILFSLCLLFFLSFLTSVHTRQEEPSHSLRLAPCVNFISRTGPWPSKRNHHCRYLFCVLSTLSGLCLFFHSGCEQQKKHLKGHKRKKKILATFVNNCTITGLHINLNRTFWNKKDRVYWIRSLYSFRSVVKQKQNGLQSNQRIFDTVRKEFWSQIFTEK